MIKDTLVADLHVDVLFGYSKLTSQPSGSSAGTWRSKGRGFDARRSPEAVESRGGITLTRSLKNIFCLGLQFRTITGIPKRIPAVYLEVIFLI